MAYHHHATPVAFAFRYDRAPRRRNNRERHSLQRLSHSSNNDNTDIVQDDKDGCIHSLLWEESMQEMAAEALVPVFYSPEYHVNTNTQKGPPSFHRGVDPEKALKTVLRRYQKSVEGGDNSSMPTTTAQERQTSRKRLSDLILGTSVMRIRHFYTLLAKKISEDNAGGENDGIGSIRLWNESITDGVTLDMESIFGVDLDMGANSVAANIFQSESHLLGERNVNTSRRIATIRALVDLHAQYMLSQKNDNARDGDIHYLESLSFPSASERISILHSLPFFFVKILVEQYGASKTEEMAAIFNQPGPITIRRNSIKCSSDNLLCERLWNEDEITTVPLSTESLPLHSSTNQSDATAPFPTGCIQLVVNHQWSPSKKSIWSMDSWKDGWFEVQDAGSQLIVEAAEVRSDDIVIDFCAGNGGKTFALVSKMYQESGKGKGGYVIAHDIVEERLRQLRGSFERIGLSFEDCHGSNSSSSSPGIYVKTTLDEGIELHSKMADVVLVDAPCSSTGVLRRRPSQRFQLQQEAVVSKLPALQTEILSEASKLVNANGKGRLVYATCSICKHENEEVAKRFEGHADFATHWKRWDFQDHDRISSSAENSSSRHCRTLLPNKDSDGFFMARWIRLQNT